MPDSSRFHKLRTRERLSIVGLQPFAEAQALVLHESEPFVEGQGDRVLAANLQVDFGTAHGAQPALGFVHDRPAVPVVAKVRVDGKIVDPAAVSFVAGHYYGNDAVAEHAYQKQLALDQRLPRDILAGIVPGTQQTAPRPQVDYGVYIGVFKRSNDQYSVLNRVRESRIYCENLRNTTFPQSTVIHTLRISSPSDCSDYLDFLCYNTFNGCFCTQRRCVPLNGLNRRNQGPCGGIRVWLCRFTGVRGKTRRSIRVSGAIISPAFPLSLPTEPT